MQHVTKIECGINGILTPRHYDTLTQCLAFAMKKVALSRDLSQGIHATLLFDRTFEPGLYLVAAVSSRLTLKKIPLGQIQTK